MYKVTEKIPPKKFKFSPNILFYMIKKTQTKKEPSYSACVLWELCYHYETLTTNRVGNIFWLTDSHASNILREMWKKGWLSRKIEYTKPHGRRFRYRMTEKGGKLFLWLENKGVFENDIEE